MRQCGRQVVQEKKQSVNSSLQYIFVGLSMMDSAQQYIKSNFVSNTYQRGKINLFLHHYYCNFPLRFKLNSKYRKRKPEDEVYMVSSLGNIGLFYFVSLHMNLNGVTIADMIF